MTRKKAYSLVGLAVVLALGITWVKISQARKAEQEQALLFELKQLRAAVEIYATASKVKPQDLPTALDAKFGFGQGVKWTVKRDDKGLPLDPFGNPYTYNTDNGWVASATPGYEKW